MNALIALSLACFRSLSVKRLALVELPPLRLSSQLQLYIGEACWAFLFGVIIGKYISLPQTFDVALMAYRSTQDPMGLESSILAVGLMVMSKHQIPSLSSLPVSSLLSGWFVSAGLIYAFIPGLDFLSSLAVGACLTPTDPILAAAVVGGKYADKHVPAHIRHLLSAECGCNDGAAYPFLFLALYLVLDSTPGRAIQDWALFLWLFEIALSIVFGSTLGFAFRHLMKFCQRNDLIDRQSYVAQYVSLAFLSIGIMTILGSDDLLAAFCCGTAFAWDGFFNRQTEEAVFSSVIDLLFNVASFVYVGAWMPFDSFSNEALTLSVGRLILTAFLILMLKRLPIMIALYKFIPDVKNFREALFSGHFGPVGIGELKRSQLPADCTDFSCLSLSGAVYISTFAVGYLPKPSNPPANQTDFLASTIQPIVAFVVLCSVAIHGLSIPFFSLGRRVHTVSSRTWSRHASGPDWATLTRHITRGEDVVINRDHDVHAMENGRAGLSEEEKTIMESRRTSTDVNAAHENGSSKTEDILEGDDAVKEQTPPDGIETTMEWKEGSDKIVERRAGPGEEVDVEIIRHAYASEGSPAPMGGFLRTAGSYIHHRRRASGGTAKSAEQTRDIEHDVSLAGAELPKESLTTAVSTEEAATVTQTEGELDNEEGWASEDSVDGTIVSSSAAQDERRRRVRSSKAKATVKPTAGAGQNKKGRRRSSASEQGRYSLHTRSLSSDTTPTLSPVENEPERAQDVLEDIDRRGRSTHHERKSSGLSHHPSIQHRRLESLKLAQRSRDASPTRSIRFADEHRSGTSTPRSGVLQNESWLLSNQVNDSPLEEDAESARGRVTFELPVKH
ncbi:Sodium/hydrogen exchanger family-domain-containing protein [Lanmaoa asiatica]|nr:Sodium/hydrogen exchanger family-domain-containing protein [Lanmaoa asiatica]